MLNKDELDNWYRRLNISEQTRKVIEKIRSSQPSRLVRSGKKNVSGRYASKKMGVTIQFESHRNELAHIYKLEHDKDVLEYYEQPPAFHLDYLSKNGKRNYHQHTPDFFVIRKDSAGWEECKTEKDLLELAEKSPNRWQRTDECKWRCPPGEEYASQFDLYYAVRSSAELNSIFTRNFTWLEDYFREKLLEVDEVVTSAVFRLLKAQPGITLAEMINGVEQATVDDLHILIATEKIYVDLNNAFLGNPEQVKVFIDEDEAFIHGQLTKVSPPNAVSNLAAVKVVVGTSICWDGAKWEILNTGERSIGLLAEDQKFIDIPCPVFEALVRDGKITGLVTTEAPTIHPEVEILLKKASPEDRQKANDRYQEIEPFLNGTSSDKPNRTQRRWIASYKKAEKIYGRGFVGLFPRDRDKGWRREGLPTEVRALMEQHIEERYENLNQHSIRHAYYDFKKLCIEIGYKPPSCEAYRQAVRNRPRYEQTKKRKGDRAAYKEEPFHWYLHQQDTPIHGDRPFEIAHIDHTEVDIELLSETMLSRQVDPNWLKENANMGKAWVTLLIDAYSRRILSVYMSFDAPSYRSDMMALRICVQTYGRLPQIIVVDGGRDLNSKNFDMLIAYFYKSKKVRPKAKPRNGSVIESFFQDELKFEIWIANTVGELLAQSAYVEFSPLKNSIAKALCAYVDQVSEGNIAAFARQLQIPRNTVWLWCKGHCLPSIKALLQVCYCLKVSIMDFISQGIEPMNPCQTMRLPPSLIQPKARASSKSFDAKKLMQFLEEVLASNECPPPSMKEVARRVKCDRGMIYRLFPDLCRAISAKYLDYRKANLARNIEQSCNEVRLIALNLQDQGVYPSENRVEEHMTMPGYLRSKKVRAALRDIQSQLCK
jgi:hypothetical protein